MIVNLICSQLLHTFASRNGSFEVLSLHSTRVPNFSHYDVWTSSTHLPHEQFSMPVSQCQAQSVHCFLEEVSQSPKIPVVPTSVINFFDFSLNVVIFSVLFKSCRKDSLFG